MKKMPFSLVLGTVLFCNTVWSGEAKLFTIESNALHGEHTQVLHDIKHRKQDYSDPKLHLLWARSAEALGKLEVAMSAYERVLILDPSNAEAKERLKNIYNKTNRQGLSTSADDAMDGRKTFSSHVALALGYDNNLNANPGALALDDYYGVIGNTGEVSSSFARLDAGLSYKKSIAPTSLWYTKAKLDIHAQDNIKAHFYDIFVGTAELGIGYDTNNYKFYVPLSFQRIDYLDTQLLNTLRFSPSLITQVNKKSIVRLHAIFSKGTFQDTAFSNRDSRTVGAKINYYYLYTKDLLFNAHIKYLSKKANNKSDAEFVDSDYLTLGVGMKYNIHKDFSLDLNYLHKISNYEDDIDDTKKALDPNLALRKDTFNQVSLRLNYKYSKKTKLYLENEYSTSNSNYTPATYNKNQVLFGISRHF